MEINKIKELIGNIKQTNERKQDLEIKYKEASKDFGKESGIARGIYLNLEKHTEKLENLKSNTDNLLEEKNKLEIEINELKEKRSELKKEGRFILSIIERDENNITKNDKIQEARKIKANKLAKNVLDLNKQIKEKLELDNEIINALNILEYKEEKEQKDVTKTGEIIETLDQKTVRVGNEIKEEISRDYKHTHLNYDINKDNIKVNKIEIKKPEDEKPEDKKTENNKLEDKKPEIKNSEEKKLGDEKPEESRKEGFTEKIINKVKSSKKYKKIIEFFGNIKNKIKLFGKNNSLMQSHAEKNNQEYDPFPNYTLEELLNNTNNLTAISKNDILKFSRKHGEEAAKNKYVDVLSIAEVNLEINKIIEQNKEKEMQERLNVNNECNRIEQNANKEITVSNVIDVMDEAAKSMIKNEER